MTVIMIGCDLHDKTMLLKIGIDKDTILTRSYENHFEGRWLMMQSLMELRDEHAAERMVFAYEASGLGFGLYDALKDWGIECHVLAPSRMAVAPVHRKRKTDERDALRILEIVKSYVLAGNEIPSVWVPDQQLRDDRELVRMRLDLGQKITTVKTQLQTLLKRHELRRPRESGKGWTLPFRLWLAEIAFCEDGPLSFGGRAALTSLLRQLGHLEREVDRLDQHIEQLASDPRYAGAVAQLLLIRGVGLLTAMVFLSELGDLSRFANRRCVASYLGLAPSSFESGESNDRKGHITRQGSARIRKVLCQATWSRVRWDPDEKAFYQKLKKKNPKKKKIAVVASMRRLGIRMWHQARVAEAPEPLLTS